jgi:hypothetical protein
VDGVKPFVAAVLRPTVAAGESRLEDLAGAVLRAAAERSSLHDATIDVVEGPSRRSLSRCLEALALTPLEALVNDELWRQGGERFPRRPVVGIDITLVPYHGEPHEKEDEVKRGPAKSGTTWFHAYATAYACVHGRRYTFLVHFVGKDETPTQALDFMLDEIQRRGIQPALVLADKGFATHDAIVSLKRRRLAFIIPLPYRGEKAKALRRGKGSYETTYELNREMIHVAVVIKRNTRRNGHKKYHGKKPGNQYFAYMAHGIHEKPKRVDKLYRLRGGIESSYKLNNKARARTTSKRPAVRMFYFAVSFFLQNAWVTLAWRVSAPTRGRSGRWRPPGFFTLTRYLRLVRAWTDDVLGFLASVTPLPSAERRR